MQLSSGQNCYLLPADEIQKMLQQNANIIRKFITDVNNGSCLLFWLSPTELIDVTEYSGLHTSVYLLSLFTKSKDGTASKTSVPVSTYQNLIKKMKQVEFQAQQQQQQQQQFHLCCHKQSIITLLLFTEGLKGFLVALPPILQRLQFFLLMVPLLLLLPSRFLLSQSVVQRGLAALGAPHEVRQWLGSCVRGLSCHRPCRLLCWLRILP